MEWIARFPFVDRMNAMLDIMPSSILAFLGPIGWQEMMLLALLGILIFGKRLPEVGKSIGKGIVEFKKGLSGIEDELGQAGKTDSQPPRVESAQRPESLHPADAQPSVESKTS